MSKALRNARLVPCLICGAKSDPCHIKSKGAGGPDSDWNILSMCRVHHREQHRSGWKSFLAKYPVVMEALIERDWEIITSIGVYRLHNDRILSR